MSSVGTNGPETEGYRLRQINLTDLRSVVHESRLSSRVDAGTQPSESSENTSQGLTAEAEDNMNKTSLGLVSRIMSVFCSEILIC